MAELLERPSTFLAADEVAELTGIRRGRQGRTYAELQVDWLLRHGYPAQLNAAGRAIVTRSAVDGARGGGAAAPADDWVPSAWRK